MNKNKFLISLLSSFIFIISIATATSYEQTAADITPGVFASGGYYFPDTVYLGTESDPRLSTTQTMYVTEGDNDYGIYARTYGTDVAILGIADDTKGVYGYSTNSSGVYGVTHSSSTSSAGVMGYATQGASGVYGYDSSGSGAGVKAYSTNYGFYTSGAKYGLYIPSADSVGVKVLSADNTGGMFTGDIYGVYGEGDSYGGYFKGDLYALYAYGDAKVTGDATVNGKIIVGSCTGCSDIAENLFGESLEAGDVVVLDASKKSGIKKTTTPYDKLAAGIVSTDPTLTMGEGKGFPIALAGVVPTKVIGTVHVGDLLTTSSTSGYAMACADMTKCTGAVIGKAMEENNAGKGKITALVMLG